jgi:hypothetical protein
MTKLLDHAHQLEPQKYRQQQLCEVHQQLLLQQVFRKLELQVQLTQSFRCS